LGADCGVDSVGWARAGIFGKDAAKNSAMQNVFLLRRYVTQKNFAACTGPVLRPDRVFCSCKIRADTGALQGDFAALFGV
jgi:hypothetical protein